MADEIEWTPRPGEAVQEDEAAPILAAFARRFRVATEGRHPKALTWVTFDPSDSRPATRRAFATRALPDDAPVFFYFETGGQELRRATMGEVRHYLAALEPWEDWDFYVFDATMRWCVALTHPQMGNRRLVIVAGDFPPKRRRGPRG